MSKRSAGRTMLLGAALASAIVAGCASGDAGSEREASLRHVREQRQGGPAGTPSEQLMPNAIELERREGPLFR